MTFLNVKLADYVGDAQLLQTVFSELKELNLIRMQKEMDDASSDDDSESGEESSEVSDGIDYPFHRVGSYTKEGKRHANEDRYVFEKSLGQVSFTPFLF